VEIYGRARHATDDNIIQRMRIACWITKASDTVIIYNITAFPRQQRVLERAAVVRVRVHRLSSSSIEAPEVCSCKVA
jgi:cytidylate kinase